MKQIRKTITALPSGNHSINFVKSSAEEQIYTNFVVTGKQTLTGNFNINPSGTPSIYTVVDILWNASITPDGHNVVIFGITIPNSLLTSGNFKVQCFYDALSGMPTPTNGWVVNIIADASSSGDVDSTRLAADSVTTAKIADDAVTLAKMAGLTKGSIIYGNASSDPTAIHVGGADGRMILGDTTNGLAVVDMSGDATIIKTGALTIANSAVTTAKIADDAVTAAKLDDDSNRTQVVIPTSFETAGEIGVLEYKICFPCTIEAIHGTVTKPFTSTGTHIFKDDTGTVLTGSQIDMSNALTLGNIVSTTPTANNTFVAGDVIKIETSVSGAVGGRSTIVLCMLKS
jgi:hypothetical protein